jgi:phosphotransferase system enzyme I (PtsI)
MYKGIAASPGIVIGPAYVLSKKAAQVNKIELAPSKIDTEVARLHTAVERTKADIGAIKERIIHDIGSSEAEIFNAYLLMLSDPTFIGKAEEIIKTQRLNTEYALHMVLQNYSEFSNRISDSYLKERSRDINSLVDKIINNLEESGGKDLNAPAEKYIVIAQDLSPADTADMNKNNVLGFVTEMGGATSHTAIVARSLELPAVVGVRDITSTAKTGDMVIIDGEKGIVVINPNPKILALYKEERKKFTIKLRMLKRLKTLEAVTIDKHKVELSANIEFPEETAVVQENNAEGVGLFRTEFIYINKSNLPSEEEQFESYKTVVQKMNPRPVTLRTLDIGGDKFLPYFKIAPEQNPFLGLRAIRLTLANLNMFKLQLRAILRASAFGKVKIMFPMITVPEELDDAKKILEEVKADLKRKEVKFDAGVKVGCMIEVPSAAIMSEELAKKVDFFSIGTNDLIQYTVAADRGNESVSYLYDPLNPAVLRLIKMIANSAHKAGIKVSVCGEMAGAPHLAFLLIGLGIDELSVSPASILSVKKLIRSVYFKDALETADAALKEDRAPVIKDMIMSRLNQILYSKENPKEKGEKK